MGKSSYTVTAILPGRERDYFDFWTRDVRTNAADEDLHPGMLAITVSVDAPNKADAEAQVRERYPKHQVDSAATKREG